MKITELPELTTVEELPALVAETDPAPTPEPAPVAEPPFDTATLATLKAQKQALEAGLSQALAVIAECTETASKPLAGDTDAMMSQLRELDGAISRKAEQSALVECFNAKLAALNPVVADLELQLQRREDRERQAVAALAYQAAGERYALAFDALQDALQAFGKAAHSANRQADFIIHCRRSAFPRLDCVACLPLRPGYFNGKNGAICVNPNDSSFQ